MSIDFVADEVPAASVSERHPYSYFIQHFLYIGGECDDVMIYGGDGDDELLYMI